LPAALCRSPRQQKAGRRQNLLSLSLNKAVATPQRTQDVQDARAAAIIFPAGPPIISCWELNFFSAGSGGFYQFAK
jgi:hypothetical protein